MQTIKNKQFDYLTSVMQRGQLHHCYIFTGEADCGQRYTINRFLQYNWCKGDNKPCGECPVCRRIAENSFSDIKVTDALITLEKTPKIDEIRDIISWAYNSPMEGDSKFVVIHNIDKLNIRAINLLLKTIEEPPERTYFILTARDKQSVLPTILSRAMIIQFEPVKDTQNDELLQLSNGRWELAQRLREEPDTVKTMKENMVDIDNLLSNLSNQNILNILALSSKITQKKGFDANIWLNMYEYSILSNEKIPGPVKVAVIDEILKGKEQKKSYCRDIAVVDNILITTFAACNSGVR